MLNSTLKLIFILILSTCFTFNIYAQDPGHIGERVKTLKKIKLLEVLNMDEASSEKFLIKFTTWENKIDEKMEENLKLSEDLENAIQSKKNNPEIVKLSNDLLKIQNDIFTINQDKQKDLKTMLNDVQFAKYLVFETKFRRELMKRLNKMKKKHDKYDRDDD